MECDGLKFALCAVADQGHHAAGRACHPACGKRGYRRCAQRGDEGHLREQQRVTCRHVSEHAERGDREQALRGVLRVTVDVFE